MSPGGGLYTSSGGRRIWPPVRFGVGVFWHLLRHGRSYDAVHSASFPFFSLLAAALALRLTRAKAPLIVDWWELWGPGYWRSYLGPLGGRIGVAVQGLCTAPSGSELRLLPAGRGAPARAERPGAEVERLTGEYFDETEPGAAGATEPAEPPLVVSAGRHIPEKRVPSIPPAIAVARERVSGLRCEIFGDGPETEATGARVRELGLDGVVDRARPGRRGRGDEARLRERPACCIPPAGGLRARHRRGVVGRHALGRGPRGPRTQPRELIEEGVNGFVADSASPRSSPTR